MHHVGRVDAYMGRPGKLDWFKVIDEKASTHGNEIASYGDEMGIMHSCITYCALRCAYFGNGTVQSV